MKMEFGVCEGMRKAAVTPEKEQEEKELVLAEWTHSAVNRL